MSFRCDVCGVVAPPHIKEVRIPKDLRPVTYSGVDADGVFGVVGIGTEMTGELRQCPACAGVAVPPEIVPNYSVHKAVAAQASKHSRSCKKRPDECSICQGIMRQFASIPLAALRTVLQDTTVATGTLPIATICVENMLARTRHNTKRSRQDFEASFRILKEFEQRGGGI